MDTGERSLHSTNVAVIREVYDNEFSQACFSMELEKALESRCSIIVIEPTQLGDETARWISFGNYLHKTAVISGLTSIISGFAWPDTFVPQAPLSIISSLCTGLYTVSWQFDHCVKYQVERDVRKLSRLPILGALTSASPVVLVRKDNTKRIIVHWAVTLASASLCIYRLYRTMK
ncbi:transmembrane protein 11-A, mitochondrial [Diabrotica virgifera virgifera]|uniref:Transmembrane protein 11-A, mitochondrial isoform X2 n=1 Tax=Diabrotica virgifera virgifera TaxID=50390 RepID=A0A6P7FDV7_DIAVI|nr:transmembrane protein 11-A, mitochondrial [Diabrotica virgifera virgifera]